MEPDVATPPSPPVPPPRRKFWKTPSFLIVSVALHLLGGAGATYLVVQTQQAARIKAFQGGPPNPSRSQKALEHRVQLAKQRRNPPPAAAPKRVALTAPAKVELPPMPMVPVAVPAPGRMAAMSAMSAAGPMGFTAPGSLGIGGVKGGGVGGLNFFGIRDAARDVVVMIDVSDSMFTRTGDASGRELVKRGAEQSFQTVRDEAGKLLQALPPNGRFGIVRWSGGAYPWREELVTATPNNVADALAHLRDGVDMKTARPRDGRPGGTRTDFALEAAFRLRPEVIYMLTDGNATEAQPGGGLKEMPPEQVWGAADAGQTTLGANKRARLHVIYYLTGADKADERTMLTSLATKNGGQFRTVDAPGRRERGR